MNVREKDGKNAFTESGVKKVLTNPKYSHYFDDYTAGSSIPAYISALIKSLKEKKWGKQQDIKLGLLFGYPPEAVEEFVKYKDERDSFLREWSNKKKQLSKEERALLAGYQYGNEVYKLYRSNTFDENRDINILFNVLNNIPSGDNNKFKEEHESEVKALLEKKFSEIEEGAVNYICSIRRFSLFGMPYLSRGQNLSDKYYCDKSHYIFEKSGMNEYLRSVTQQNFFKREMKNIKKEVSNRRKNTIESLLRLYNRKFGN